MAGIQMYVCTHCGLVSFLLVSCILPLLLSLLNKHHVSHTVLYGVWVFPSHTTVWYSAIPPKRTDFAAYIKEGARGALPGQDPLGHLGDPRALS